MTINWTGTVCEGNGYQPIGEEGSAPPVDFVSSTVYADSTALETAFPAASNNGLYGLVVDGPMVRVYVSTGGAWAILGDVLTGFVGDTSGTEILADAAALETAFPAASNTGSFGLAYLAGDPRVYEAGVSDWALLDSVPTYSVSTFSALPSDATVGQRVAITAEAGLADVSVVNTALDTWELERVSCLWSALPTSGTWYSSGGITVTTETDTTVSITGINDLVSGAAVWTGAKWRWAVNAEYFVISGVQSSTVEITAVSIPTGQLDPISNP